jgi:hypothetical protein
MKHFKITLASLFMLLAAIGIYAQEKVSATEIGESSNYIVPIPNNYFIIDSVMGNLNKDSIKELAVVYNTGPDNKIEGVSRELVIYILIHEKWTEWEKSSQAILRSNEGGIMGDPFQKIEIKNGILLINHYGGSRWQWGYTDKYRFQNGKFYLIGFNSIEGSPCEYSKEVDFNLSTGKLVVKKEFQVCTGDEELEIHGKKENEILFEKGHKITLELRNKIGAKIVTPKYGHVIDISH